MRKIKFRGERIDGKGYAYGDLTHRYESEEILVDNWVIYPESVALLIGYDCDENEIYEGDKLINSSGIEFTAELWDMGVNALDADTLNNGIFKFKLKNQSGRTF